MTHTIAVGNRAEAKILAALLDHYDTVLLPYGINCRYDMVVETPTGFQRIQCKNGKYKNGCVIFPTCSVNISGKTTVIRPYYGEADYFGVYCPDLQTVYLVPVDECGFRSVNLRIEPTKSNRKDGVRWAKDYLLSPSTDLNRTLRSTNAVLSAE